APASSVFDQSSRYEIKVHPLAIRRTIPCSLQHSAPAIGIETVVQGDKQGFHRNIMAKPRHIPLDPGGGMFPVDQNKFNRYSFFVELSKQPGHNHVRRSRQETN